MSGMTNRTVVTYAGDQPVIIGEWARPAPSHVAPGDLTVVDVEAAKIMVETDEWAAPKAAELADALEARGLAHTGKVDELNARLAEATLEYVVPPEPEPAAVDLAKTDADTEPNGQDA